MAAIVSAVPHLRAFDMLCESTCHPAFSCAIVGCYCQHIEEVSVEDARHHEWKNAHTADITAAYQSAVAATGRGGGYRPFTQLCRLNVSMCCCTPPSVWHALLSLLRHAVYWHCAARLASNDPLAFLALSYLPSLTTLVGDCLWPLSFANFMQQPNEQNGRYRYLASHEVSGEECVAPAHIVELTDSAEVGQRFVRLRPDSDLFSAYSHSLRPIHWSAVARWAAGDFQAGY